VDERRWLIRPPEQVDYFDVFNTALHGIDAETVKDAPRWNLVLPALVDYIDDDIVVAHNAGFDIGVIRYACAVDNIEWPDMHFLCTLVLRVQPVHLTHRAPLVPRYRMLHTSVVTHSGCVHDVSRRGYPPLLRGTRRCARRTVLRSVLLMVCHGDGTGLTDVLPAR